jgi:hypothetical protein
MTTAANEPEQALTCAYCDSVNDVELCEDPQEPNSVEVPICSNCHWDLCEYQ